MITSCAFAFKEPNEEAKVCGDRALWLAVERATDEGHGVCGDHVETVRGYGLYEILPLSAVRLRMPGERQLAARCISSALGETGAPWDDVCARNACSHSTCDAVWALVDNGLLGDEAK